MNELFELEISWCSASGGEWDGELAGINPVFTESAGRLTSDHWQGVRGG